MQFRPAARGVAILTVLALQGIASAQATSAWTLTTSDFQTRPVTVIAIDDAGARVTEQGAAENVIPWQRILQLERAALTSAPVVKPTTGPSKFTLFLANGDRLTGEAAALEGENLTWSAPAAGSMNVKLKEVAAIARAGEQQPRRDAQRAEDVVSLTNGDTARGLISAVDKKSVTVTAEGNPVVVPWESIRSVVLAAVPAEAAGGERGIRLTLTDGSVMSGSRVALAGEQVTLTAAAGAKRELAAAAVSIIEQTNGPVAWLSSLAPTESVQTPYLETVFPARMDRTVRGDPIRFADRTYPRGIGAHAYSRLTWQLPESGRYKTFRTRYAIDGDKPYANVTVRVKLDDKVVHEAQDFVAGKLSDVVQVPLAGAKSLTLEVDYGKTYDVQDRFNWIEPALLAE